MENTNKQVIKLSCENCLLVASLGCIWSLHKGYLIEKWSERISGENHVNLKRGVQSIQACRGWQVDS